MDEAQFNASGHVAPSTAARAFCRNNNDPDAYASVAPASGAYVTIGEIKESGLGYLLGEMEIDALRYGPVAGRA